MEKNQPGTWTVFAYGLPDNANPGQPITGDAANITAQISIDGAAPSALTDVNPVELGGGNYVFDLTAAETNGDQLTLIPTSSTADVQVIGVPGSVFTTPANFNDTAITATTGLVDITQAAADKAWLTATRALTTAANITSDASAITMSSAGVIGTVNLVNTVTLNSDMRGTDNAFLATSAPTNFSSLGISAGGFVSVNWGSLENPSAVNNLTNTTVNATATDNSETFSGTLAAGSAGGGTFPGGAPWTADSEAVGQTIVITGGTGQGQSRTIATYVQSTGVFTVSPNFDTAVDATSTFSTFGSAPASETNLPSVNAAEINGATVQGDGTGGNLWRG